MLVENLPTVRVSLLLTAPCWADQLCEGHAAPLAVLGGLGLSSLHIWWELMVWICKLLMTREAERIFMHLLVI